MNTGDQIHICRPTHTFGRDDWKWDIFETYLVALGPTMSAFSNGGYSTLCFALTRHIHASRADAEQYAANNDVRRDPAVLEWLRDTNQPIVVEAKH